MVQREVLEKNPSSQLAAYIIWLPVLPNDNHYHAIGARRLALDPRALHFWNEDQSLGAGFVKALPLSEDCKLAWDVYLVYRSGVKWERMQPPQPSFWMHQLSCMRSQELRLEGKKLREAVYEAQR